MKLHLASDLHLEFGNTYFPTVEADGIILAGDISIRPGDVAELCFNIAQKYKYVFLVLGNHDFYGMKSIPLVTTYLKEKFKNTNIYLLNNEEIILENKRIFGGIMWSDCLGLTKQDIIFLNDFIHIRDLTLLNMRSRHGDFRKELDTMKKYDLIISHFSPAIELVAEKYKNNILNTYFHATDMAKYIKLTKTWCYGHTHDATDTMLGNTRMLCNPLGYPREYTNFNKELTFTI